MCSTNKRQTSSDNAAIRRSNAACFRSTRSIRTICHRNEVDFEMVYLHVPDKLTRQME